MRLKLGAQQMEGAWGQPHLFSWRDSGRVCAWGQPHLFSWRDSGHVCLEVLCCATCASCLFLETIHGALMGD